jgi:rare lipoprotein A
MYALTAAHKEPADSLLCRASPIWAMARQVVVRVNDRGPFHDDRLIDLSYGAALQLGFADVGLAQVRIEVINASATPLSPTAAVVASTPKPTRVSAENGVPAVIKRKPPGSTTAARSAAEAGAVSLPAGRRLLQARSRRRDGGAVDGCGEAPDQHQHG